MSAAITINGALEEMGTDEDGATFARIEREAGSVFVYGLTSDEVRALAPCIFSIVTLTIGGAA